MHESRADILLMIRSIAWPTTHTHTNTDMHAHALTNHKCKLKHKYTDTAHIKHPLFSLLYMHQHGKFKFWAWTVHWQQKQFAHLRHLWKCVNSVTVHLIVNDIYLKERSQMSNKQKIFGSYESSISLTSITVILIFLRFTSKIVQSILEPVILIQSNFIYREHKKTT